LAYAFVVVAAFAPRMPLTIKLAVLVGASLLVGGVVLAFTGPLGAGYIWFIIAVVLSALFGRTRVVAVTITVTMTIMTAWSLALWQGAEGHGATPATVVVIGASLLIGCLMLASVTRRLLDVLAQALAEREQLAARLSQELEQSNAIRTELKAGLELKESLLRELQHRVRNNLQSVQSLLALDDDDTGGDRTFFDDARRRINALTVTNDLFLSSPDDGRIDGYELVCSIAQHIFDGRNEGFCSVHSVCTAEAYLDTQTAVLVAILVSDLVSKLSYSGPSTIVFEGRARGFRIELHSEAIVEPEYYKAIYEHAAASRIAKSSAPEIGMGTLAIDGERGPGLYLEVSIPT